MSASVLVRQGFFLDSHSTRHGADGRRLSAIACLIDPVFHVGLQFPSGILLSTRDGAHARGDDLVPSRRHLDFVAEQ